MIILGGTYKEVNEYDNSEVIYGSGVRALETILALDDEVTIDFHTCCRRFSRTVNLRYASYNRVNWHITDSEDISFYYIHPFNLSGISPRPDYFIRNRKTVKAGGHEILLFGMVEADFCIDAKRVVYDPQSSAAPLLFSQTGSNAEHLSYVLNLHEAKSMSGLNNINELARFFFENENCECLVIKNGASGAYVFEGNPDNFSLVPVYETPKVHCIGSGDVFSAAYANYWFKGYAAVDAANYASKVTALYAANGSLNGIFQGLRDFPYIKIEPKHEGKIYLAGPFFSFSQRWMICEFYKALQQENIKIFSPLHNVGIGGEETASLDIKGLEESNAVLAIADGLDAGTMFEVGYAVKHGIPVVVFNSCENGNDLQMLSGTGCEMVTDFATAVYKSIWNVIK